MTRDEMYSHLERHVDALKTNRTGDERQTVDEVFDRQTLMTIYGFMTSGVIESVRYPIATGKEGNVFYATDADGDPLALKIFRTSTSTFKRVSRYIEGDPRFKGLTGNRRKMIHAWVNKEYRNLQRYYEAEIPVPEPVAYDKNCLVMEFIGDGDAAPQLRECMFDDTDEVYDEVISFIIDGYKDAHLVHGDLSEYNILMWDGQPIMIDCGQAITADHFNANEFLRRDIVNINRFFKNRGADIIDTEIIMQETLSDDDEDEEDDDHADDDDAEDEEDDL
jgi:RIO kinase 1